MKQGRSPLTEYIPFLVNRTAIASHEYSNALFQQFNLTVPKLRVLFALADHGMLRVGELSEITSIELPTLSRIIKALQAEKLIRRRRSLSDERVVELSLAPAGSALIEKSNPFSAKIEAVMTGGLEKAELRALRRALKKMYENLREANAASTPDAASAS